MDYLDALVVWSDDVGALDAPVVISAGGCESFTLAKDNHIGIQITVHRDHCYNL